MEVTINYTMITVMPLVLLPYSLAKEISNRSQRSWDLADDG